MVLELSLLMYCSMVSMAITERLSSEQELIFSVNCRKHSASDISFNYYIFCRNRKKNVQTKYQQILPLNLPSAPATGKCMHRADREEWRRRNMYADYGGMVQPRKQHVAPYVKRVEWRLGNRGFRMMAAF